MSYFRFRVLDQNGRISGGIIKLPYSKVHSVIDHLERDGSSAISVKKLGNASSKLLKLAVWRPKRSLPREFKAEFLRVVAMMLRSGMILTNALEEAAFSSERPDFESDIADMIMNIQAGMPFSEAAAKLPHIFPKTVVHLIRIGEETGRLDAMLEDAAEHLTRLNSIISDTKQAMIYPAMVFTALIAAMIFWFYYVVPKIMTLFTEMDVELPWITKLLLVISDFVQNYIFHVLLGIVVIVLVVAAARKSSVKFKKFLDGILLQLPVVGSIINSSILAFISEYFYILLNAGLDLLASMDILRDAIGNEIYKEKLEEVRESMKNGNGVSESFASALIFPPFVIRMINTGEVSGSLPEQLAYVAENYRRTLSVLVSSISKLIEPIILTVAGIIFAIIIGGLLLPIYDLVSTVAG